VFSVVEGDVIKPQCRDVEQTTVVQQLYPKCLCATLVYTRDNQSSYVGHFMCSISVPVPGKLSPY